MRQAVVIIHGIGDQRPMQTLRAFVKGALGLSAFSPDDGVFSKPDRISDSLELRRLHVPQGIHGRVTLDEGSEADFYELYWQHLLQGTEWQHVWRWAIPLLCWRPLTPRLEKMRAHAFVLLAAAATVLAVAWWAAGTGNILAAPAVLAAAALAGRILLGTWNWFGLRYLGDAARYLDPDPANIEVRHRIRSAGLELLRGLHEDPLRRYERIVLVGHSLGSVVAYDVITWLWQELHHQVILPGHEPPMVLTRPAGIERLRDEDPLRSLRTPDPPANAAFQASQRQLWEKLTAPGPGLPQLPWRITDLVTLGSPLAHADVLLADSPGEFRLGVAQREFPSCPPAEDDDRDRKLLVRTVKTSNGEQEVRILHHGAPFAVTRWTNLFFSGDFIAGPVQSLFGSGVKDVPLHSIRGESWRSHTRYWSLDEPAACDALRAALHLTSDARSAGAAGDPIRPAT